MLPHLLNAINRGSRASYPADYLASRGGRGCYSGGTQRKIVMIAKMEADAELKRGPESWAYLYIALGFALSIEGTLIQMIEPLWYPLNIATYIVVMAITAWLFICNGWFQNKLIGIKIRYESTFR